MKQPTPIANRLRASILLVTGIGLAVLCPTSVAFAQAPATKPAAKAAAPTSRPAVRASVVLPKLEQAYKLLAAADSDYQGHRDLAMKEIADTCLLLGKKLSPPVIAKGQQQQLSDLQIRSLQMVLLEIARSITPGDNNAPVIAHLNGAISQLAQGITANRSQSGADGSNQTNANRSAAGSSQGAGSGQPANNGTGSSTAGNSGSNNAGLKNNPAVRGPLIIDNPVNTNMVEIGALEDIYETLTFANHNYAGHRAKAMNAISRVVTTLGATVRGDGRARIQQIVSDQHLRYAQFLLHQVCQSFSTNDPKAILDDLTLADNELTTALTIR